MYCPLTFTLKLVAVCLRGDDFPFGGSDGEGIVHFLRSLDSDSTSVITKVGDLAVTPL